MGGVAEVVEGVAEAVEGVAEEEAVLAEEEEAKAEAGVAEAAAAGAWEEEVLAAARRPAKPYSANPALARTRDLEHSKTAD
ncbi:MAG: hypothetical protein WC421_10625 [Elusimicrobiales bacterium]